MDRLLARKPSELALGLKLLYARGIAFFIELEERNGKIVYLICIREDEELEKEIAEEYRILIS